jgi:hypothetical protein
MKRIFLIFVYIMVSNFLFAQPETGKTSKSFPILPLINKPESKPLDLKPLNSNPFSKSDTFINNEPFYKSDNNLLKDKKKPSFVIGEKRDNILDPKPGFINPDIGVLDKLNGKGIQVSENFKAIRGNLDLGNFKIKSKFVNIRYRDFGEVDGDQIRIYVNGRVIENLIILDNYFQGVEIMLETGFNKIDFEAINQGTVGPNTAEFQVFDDNKKLVSTNQWNLVTGFKASIMVFKE